MNACQEVHLMKWVWEEKGVALMGMEGKECGINGHGRKGVWVRCVALTGMPRLGVCACQEARSGCGKEGLGIKGTYSVLPRKDSGGGFIDQSMLVV